MDHGICHHSHTYGRPTQADALSVMSITDDLRRAAARHYLHATGSYAYLQKALDAADTAGRSMHHAEGVAKVRTHGTEHANRRKTTHEQGGTSPQTEGQE